jgi:hypothetical protein
MPLRSLIYYADIVRLVVKDRALYSRKRIPIDTPRFVVFYNGKEERPEKEILHPEWSWNKQFRMLSKNVSGSMSWKSFCGQGKWRLVCKKLRRHKSVSEIAEDLEEDEEIIKEMCDVAEKYAPEYDVDKVMEEWFQDREK